MHSRQCPNSAEAHDPVAVGDLDGGPLSACGLPFRFSAPAPRAGRTRRFDRPVTSHSGRGQKLSPTSVRGLGLLIRANLRPGLCWGITLA